MLPIQDVSFLSYLTKSNSERDGNTRPPDLLLEKSVCRSGSNKEEKGTTEDEMAGWHHRLNGREFD